MTHPSKRKGNRSSGRELVAALKAARLRAEALAVVPMTVFTRLLKAACTSTD